MTPSPQLDDALAASQPHLAAEIFVDRTGGENADRRPSAAIKP
jgi:hypothetical protein